MLELPELYELEQHVVRVQQRDDQSCRALPEPAAEDIVPRERECRMHGDTPEPGVASILVELTGGDGGVAIDRLQMIGDRGIRIVLQLATESADRPADANRLVDVDARPGSTSPVVQSKLPVGPPIRAANPSPEIEGHPWNAVTTSGRRLVQDLPDFRSERFADALVRVHGEDPVVSRQRRGVVLLRGIAFPGACLDADPVSARDVDGIVGAAAVDDDPFVGPGDRSKSRPDVGRLVAGDDRHRNRWHQAQL